ncbi:MAG: hypothetical protein IT332_13055 [Ardenticatenales bacterium]|nr:hypothetical protein [Ardenticatenales bacterium]
MEHTPHDHRLLRAARSLHNNRAREAVLRKRIETGEGALTEWLIASGTTHALLGLFELHLEAGEIHVTKRDVPDSDQLPLPHLYPETVAPHEQLGFGLDLPDTSAHRVAEPDGYTRRLDRLSGLSESELASLARAVLSSLATAEVAPLLARHEAGVALSHPSQVFALLSPEMSGLAQEQLRVLTLNTRHGLLGTHLVYQGTVRESPVRPAEVFRPAVVQQAPGVIVAHNHPSGDPTPSTDDFALTRQLVQAGNLLGVRLVDHIVIAGSTFYSFREGGHIPPDAVDRVTVSGASALPIDILDPI